MPSSDSGELPDKRSVRERIGEYVAMPRVYCIGCGRPDPGGDRGWTLQLDEDDDLMAFCPDCYRQRFGETER